MEAIRSGILPAVDRHPNFRSLMQHRAYLADWCSCFLSHDVTHFLDIRNLKNKSFSLQKNSHPQFYATTANTPPVCSCYFVSNKITSAVYLKQERQEQCSNPVPHVDWMEKQPPARLETPTQFFPVTDSPSTFCVTISEECQKSCSAFPTEKYINFMSSTKDQAESTTLEGCKGVTSSLSLPTSAKIMSSSQDKSCYPTVEEIDAGLIGAAVSKSKAFAPPTPKCPGSWSPNATWSRPSRRCSAKRRDA